VGDEQWPREESEGKSGSGAASPEEEGREAGLWRWRGNLSGRRRIEVEIRHERHVAYGVKKIDMATVKLVAEERKAIKIVKRK